MSEKVYLGKLMRESSDYPVHTTIVGETVRAARLVLEEKLDEQYHRTLSDIEWDDSGAFVCSAGPGEWYMVIKEKELVKEESFGDGLA